MATLKLKAAIRTPDKKGGARRLRRAGRFPAILYGHGEESTPMSIDAQEFEALLRAREGTVIVEVDLESRGTQQTIIRQIQRDPLNGRVLHLDLQHISLTETVHVEVPLHIVGTAFGVKTEGGVLEHHVRTLEIRCLPTAIPQRIDVDVTELRIGKSLHIEDLEFDRDAVELLSDPRAVVVGVLPPRVAVEPAVAEVAEGEEAADAEAATEESSGEAAADDKDKDKDKGKDRGKGKGRGKGKESS